MTQLRRDNESTTTSPHLTVRPDNVGPGEVQFAFQQRDRRFGGAVGISAISHAVIFAVVMILVRLAPEPTRQAFLPPRSPDGIVWIAQPGPGGGGGGGGEPEPAPPSQLELPGEDALTVPEPEPIPVAEPEPEPLQRPIQIAALTMNSGAVAAPGVLDSGNVSATVSRGSGEGTGAGEGDGDGLGEGSGGGTGGGVFQAGNGVESPRLVSQVRPNYTAEAMRAQVQGEVMLSAVVRPDGTVTDIQVVRSLDQVFGLDDQAVLAASQWRFQPGTRFGEPVAVFVNLVVEFSIR